MYIRTSLASLFRTGFVTLLCSSPVAFSQPAPCTLITQDQLKSVLGEPVSAGSPIANTGCSWKATGASKATVTVSMQSDKMFAAAKSAPDAKKASGIGDDATFVGMVNFASLWVKKGSKFVLLRLYGPVPSSDAQSKLTTLAKTVVSKL